MGERNLLLTYFNNFNSKRTLVSKNMPKVLPSIQNRTKSLEHFYGGFMDLWPCLFTTKLNYSSEVNLINREDLTIDHVHTYDHPH